MKIKSATIRLPYCTHQSARSPLHAIRLFCLECMGSGFDQDGREHRAIAAVRDCPCEGQCSLWKYRLGRNPARAGIGGKTPRELAITTIERRER